MTPSAFVSKWSQIKLKETAAAHSHFNDICAVMGHTTLDRAVLDAYGWPHHLTDEQILERLLALNLARAAAQNV